MKRSNWPGIYISAVIIVFSLVWIPINADAQVSEIPPLKALKYVAPLGGIVFFYEDGLDPSTGNPIPPPSQALAPITEFKTFEFEIGRVVIPAKSLKELLQIDLHLRQRYFYRNDGQGHFKAYSNPIVEIENAALPETFRFSFLGNGLHLAASKTLTEGEEGYDSRGNFGREIITAEYLDRVFGPSTGSNFFKNDITIRIYINNSVRGLWSFVVGAWGQIYGY